MADTDVDNEDKLELDKLGDSTSVALDLAKVNLEKFLGKKVKMSPPKIILPSILDDDLDLGVGQFERDGIKLSFAGNHIGDAYILFDSSNVDILIQELSGEEPGCEGWEEIHEDVLKEIGNIVLNSCVGTVSNALKDKVIYEVPKKVRGRLEDFVNDGFGSKYEVCFLGMGLFNIDELEIYGSICFVFYFDDLEKVFLPSK